jgi:hypothetical protein
MSKPKLVNQRDQVQKILDTLHRHGDLISMSLAGRISDINTDEATGKGIAALTSVGALMPIGDGAYQINPRIRRFLNERLSQFGALQALTRISEQLQAGRAQWRELIAMQASGDIVAKSEIEDALIYTVGEIVYFMRQNLRLLTHQTATDFGNVESMKRKLRQNRFYGENVKTLITELDQLDAFLSIVETDSLQFNLHEMRNLLMGQIKSQIGHWRHQLNEIQSLISQRLFVRRLIEADLHLLLDAGLWLETNPTLNGLEVELGQSAPPDLLSPTSIKIRPHFDVRPKADDQEKILCGVASKLPANKVPEIVKEQRAKQVVLASEPEIAETEPSPEDILVQGLIETLRISSGAFEILQWQRDKRLEAGIGDEEWLFYASSQLAIAGIRTELQIFTGHDTFNAVFDNVMAYPE